MEKRWTGKRLWRAGLSLAGVALLAAGVLGSAVSAPTSNIRETVHNLSRSGKPNDLSNIRAPAGGETAVCAFCHTPHAASTNVKGPLWNRSLSNATYTRYTSSSLDANTIAFGFNDQPAGSSLLCLSCHDGMVALGNVNVLMNQPGPTVDLGANTNAGKMPPGPQGGLSGFTRLLGTDLTNDHPISFTYNDALAVQDTELTRLTTGTGPEAQRDKLTGNLIGIRTNGYKPLLPLEPTGPGGSGQVQCGTCHDPHLAEQKFLRLKRFQLAAPTGGQFNENLDQICLACHPKLGISWAESAHANPLTADEQYLPDAAARRNFPSSTQVWQAACLNCHDTHSVQGSRRLLREGVEGQQVGTGSGAYRPGSAITPADTVSAIESTCYQCHDNPLSGTRVIAEATGMVPNVKSEFERTVRMPIATSEQLRNKREVHDIVDSDFIESPELLGKNNPEYRHVECTDCHNPHRVRRANKFYGKTTSTGDGALRTHTPGGTVAMKGADGNVASGVLRGTWGVEPVFGPTSSTWPQLPIDFIVKKGDPGLNTSTDRNKTYLTREYQLCFKCHSNYSNSDDFKAFPALGNTVGGTAGTPSSRNYLSRYTNVAAEFGSVRATDPPSTGTDQGEYVNLGNACNGGDCEPNGSYPNTGTSYNHRSWHPVMWPTGRDRKERTMAAYPSAVNMLAPFNVNIGTQTMYCSDCHGQSTSWKKTFNAAGNGPDLTKTQGPHGSDNNFLLKGEWNGNVTVDTVDNAGTNWLCGNCHIPSNGGGFSKHNPSGDMGDSKMRCMNCHVAVPHGWKNKAFLVNGSCVGTEGAEAGNCNSISGYGTIRRPPYYNDARLRVSTWARSGEWGESNCGSGMTSC